MVDKIKLYCNCLRCLQPSLTMPRVTGASKDQFRGDTAEAHAWAEHSDNQQNCDMNNGISGLKCAHKQTMSIVPLLLILLVNSASQMLLQTCHNFRPSTFSYTHTVHVQ